MANSEREGVLTQGKKKKTGKHEGSARWGGSGKVGHTKWKKGFVPGQNVDD